MHMEKSKKIAIYTQPNCPYCDAAKSLLDWNEFNYTEIDVSKLSKHANKNTVLFQDEDLPQIFIDDEHIGSYQQLVEFIAQRKL